MIKDRAPFYMGGGGTETKLDLQRFAEVSNPYNDELEEDIEVSSNIALDITIAFSMDIALHTAAEFIINSAELPNGYTLISSDSNFIRYIIPSGASIANIIPEIKINDNRFIFNYWDAGGAVYTQENLKNQTFTASTTIIAVFVRHSSGGGSSGRP